jgi:hypothetical protein
MEAAAPNQLVGLDVEQVREVGGDLDLDRQPDRARSVVDDVVVLVDAAGHRPVEADRQGVAGDRADLVEQVLVRVLEARRVELDRRRIEQDRPPPVDVEVVAGHEPGVASEEPFLGTDLDPPIWLADQDPVVPIDRDRRRADLDGQGHGRMIGLWGRTWPGAGW